MRLASVMPPVQATSTSTTWAACWARTSRKAKRVINLSLTAWGTLVSRTSRAEVLGAVRLAEVFGPEDANRLEGPADADGHVEVPAAVTFQ